MNDQHLFTIGPILRSDDLRQVMELQALVLGDSPVNHLHLPTIIDYHHNGEHLLGVFEDNQLFGFAVAYFGTYNRDPRRPAMANLKLVLDRVVIHPDYRAIGLGSQLLRQLREIAVSQAVRLMTATFSPLNSRMAYLMVRKLGSIINNYNPNYYSSDLVEDFSTSTQGQLIAEWWLTQNRVEERLFGKRSLLSLTQYLDVQTPIINPTESNGDGLVLPYDKEVYFNDETMLLVEVPPDHATLSLQNEALGYEWRDHIQTVMKNVFDAGYIATDFLYDTRAGRLRSFYLMSYDGPRISIEVDPED